MALFVRMTRARVSRYAVVCGLLVVAVNGCGVARAIPSAPPPEKRVPGWVEIARTATTTAFLDTARLERQANGIVDAWFRLVYSPPIKPDFFPPVDYEAAESFADRSTGCGLDKRWSFWGGRLASWPLPSRNGNFARI
jgi:hypothetical protein